MFILFPMKLLLDQNIRSETLDFLRDLELDVTSTRELKIERLSDDEIMEIAKELNRIVVTFNSDFGDIRYFPPGSHPGVIRLKIEPQILEVVHPILKYLFKTVKHTDLENALTIVTESKIRIRK